MHACDVFFLDVVCNEFHVHDNSIGHGCDSMQ